MGFVMVSQGFASHLTKLALFAAFAAAVPMASAQSEVGAAAKFALALQEKQGEAAKPAQAKPEEKKEEKKADAPKTIDETVKDFTKNDGLFTFYRQKKGSSETVYLELPEAKLEKLMLLQVTAGSGLGDTTLSGIFHGEPISDLAFKFKKVNDKLQMVMPNLYHRSTKPETKRTIERSFPDNILYTFEIKAQQPDRKSLLIDVSDIFKGDVADIGSALSGPDGGYGIDGSKSFVDQFKIFPENVFVRTVYTLQRRGPDPSTPKTVPFAVTYNLSELPDTGYRPRLGDPRVGYFTSSYENLDDLTNPDQTVNYIQRWNLVKKDPKAAMSEPVKPILFYLDNAIPLQYRGAVKDGLLMYNKAFEKVGIKNAIVVKQMPDDADWDIADLRYNVIRWTTGMPFAIALFRSNPVTGEILNACINMDGVFVTGGGNKYDVLLDPAARFQPQTPEVASQKDFRACSLQAEGAPRFQFAMLAMDTLRGVGIPFSRDEFIKQYVSEVVAHEMGHCLGLRHNFAASNELSMEQLGSAAAIKKYGTGASVMDYNDFNIAAIKHKGVDGYAQQVGTYDYWAIDYGYRSIEASTPQGELPALKKIASKSGLPGYRYMSDGTADSYDVYSTRFDLASEPLDYYSRQIEVARYILLTIGKSKPSAGRSYYDFTRNWVGAMNTYLRASAFMPRYIGGIKLSNSFKGDDGGTLPINPIEGAKQKKALEVLNTYVFAPNAFAFPKEDMLKLTFYPNTDGNEASSLQRQFPMLATFQNFQKGALGALYSPTTLSRVANNEFRVSDPSQTLTLATLIRSTSGNIWSEVGTSKEISELRRQLQREHLNLLIGLALRQTPGAPDDARTLAFEQLVSLKSRLAAAAPTAPGEYGKAHLTQCLARIQKALDSQVVTVGG